MITTHRAGWLLAAWMFILPDLFAQSSVQEDISRADKQFDLYAYNLALRTYEQVLKAQPTNAHALARMGDCYFQLNRPQEALPWYERAALRNDAEPEALLRYGKALMQTGDYAGAKKWFVLYGEGNPAVGQQYSRMCDYALQASQKDPLFTALDEGLNTDAADYAPAFYGDRVVFNSARTDLKRKASAKTSADWTGSAYNQLFVSQRNPADNYLQYPSFLQADLQNVYNIGPVSFTPDGRRVAFCRNNFIDGTRQIAEKGVNMSLYIADVSEGNWLNERAFPYNGSTYATGFPCFAPDGNTLYFASSQDGGMGGWDLYVTNWNGASWTTPRNLGAPVNTPGNEVTPFFDGTQLYFSSDWHQGMGGLDVFRADAQDNMFRNVVHLGPGINSPRDDYGFIFNSRSSLGYLTSNRNGGRGNEDIWQIRKRVDEFAITVTDPQQKPIPAADIDFSACNGGVKQTDAFGKYSFAVAAGKADCQVAVRKAGYRSVTLPIQSAGEKSLTAILYSEYPSAAATPSYNPASPYAPATTPSYNPSSPYTPVTTPAYSPSSAYAPVSTAPNTGALPSLENTAPQTYNYTNYPVENGTLEQFTVYVRDDMGRPLPAAELNLSTCGLGTMYTDGIGRASFYFPKGSTCSMVIRKSGLEDITVPINNQTSREMSISMSADKRTKFSGLVLDAATRRPLQNAVVTAKSRQGNHQTLASSNASGQYTVLLRPFQVYDIEYTHEGYLNFVSTIQTERALQADMELSPITLEPTAAAYRASSANVISPVVYSTPSSSPPGMISLADLETVSGQNPPVYSNVVTPPIVTGSPIVQPVTPAKTTGYAIQLAAQAETFNETKTRKYDDLAQYGNLYAVKEGNKNKLRLGVYPTREAANAVQKEVVKTHKDAFVVWESDADKSLVVGGSNAPSNAYIATKGLDYAPAKTTSPYNGNTIRFAVQVASWPADRTVLVSDYANLNTLGHVYIQPENDRMRVRVGTWDSYERADAAQRLAVQQGYKDAIVVTENMEAIANDRLRSAPQSLGTMAPKVSGTAAPQQLSTAAPAQYSYTTPVQYSTSTVNPPATSSTAKAKYYVRVCALDDTQNFDAKKLDGSGAVIEKWPIGDTKKVAIMLTGFTSVEQAMTATDKLRGKGFQDAYIIRDENGKMSKFRY